MLSDAEKLTVLCLFVQIVLPPHLERIREKLAENIHELWVMNKIELGWTYGAVSSSQSPEQRTACRSKKPFNLHFSCKLERVRQKSAEKDHSYR